MKNNHKLQKSTSPALIFGAVLVITLAACSFQTNQYDAPSEINSGVTPDYVVENRYNGHDLCTVIDQETLWRPNNNASTLAERIIHTAVITVDNRELSKSFMTYNEIYPVWRDDRLIGSYGGNIEFCFELVSLDIGVHNVLLSFEIPSSEKFSYSWSFTK